MAVDCFLEEVLEDFSQMIQKRKEKNRREVKSAKKGHEQRTYKWVKLLCSLNHTIQLTNILFSFFSNIFFPVYQVHFLGRFHMKNSWSSVPWLLPQIWCDTGFCFNALQL